MVRGMWHRGMVLSALALLVACGGQQVGPESGPSTTPDVVSPAVVVAVDEPAPLSVPESGVELAAAEDDEATLSTVARLIHAIDSDRTIRLRPGTYDLGSTPGATTEHVRWDKVYDGHELVIHDVENLTIVAASEKRPEILARPRYAFVLKLENVKNVTLDRLVLGHTPEGGCTGGVVGLDHAENVRIVDSDLYGSGTVGVSLQNVQQFRFDHSSIRECTYGIAYVHDASDVVFSDSSFVDNAEFDLVEVSGSKEVRFDRCLFSNNRTGKGYGYVFFRTDARSSVVLDRTTLENNDVDQLTNERSRLKIVGGKTAAAVSQQLSKPDPQYNQVYAVARYRKWLVAGTQAGIVFWDPATGKVDKLVKAYISAELLVRGKQLWAGTYQRVIRFDGLNTTNYLDNQVSRGGSLMVAPGNRLVVHQDKLVQQPDHWWEYDTAKDQFTPLPVAGPLQMPSLLGGASVQIFYDLLVRRNGQIWWVDFGTGVSRQQGNPASFPIRSNVYPGSDPRRLYEDPRGKLWVIDFDSGFLRFDDGKASFAPDSPVRAKGSDMVVDAKRGRTWFLHYTDGLYLEQAGKPTTFIDLSSLQYMRSLLLDDDGSVWVAGWNALVHVRPQGAGGWGQESFVVSSATVPAGVGP